MARISPFWYWPLARLEVTSPALRELAGVPTRKHRELQVPDAAKCSLTLSLLSFSYPYDALPSQLCGKFQLDMPSSLQRTA